MASGLVTGSSGAASGAIAVASVLPVFVTMHPMAVHEKKTSTPTHDDPIPQQMTHVFPCHLRMLSKTKCKSITRDPSCPPF